MTATKKVVAASLGTPADHIDAIKNAAIAALEAGKAKDEKGFYAERPLVWLRAAGKAARVRAGKDAIKADVLAARDAAVAWIRKEAPKCAATVNVMNAKFIAGAGFTDNKKGAGAPTKAAKEAKITPEAKVTPEETGNNGALRTEFTELVEYALAEKGEIYQALRALVAQMQGVLDGVAA